VCVRVHACVCINILKQPYSSTPSVATQWLDMQLPGYSVLMEPFT